ncbi:hypothetical protein [Mariniphaga sp.]|uniref:hypothetical protein n=1 Tax=Mariniphaga sp. TaxID=1954475 RepID=UPI003568C3BE
MSNLYYFLPDDLDESLKNDIKAAFVKYHMGYKTLEIAKNKIKNLNPSLAKKEPYNLLLEDILNTVWQAKTEFRKNLDNLKLKEETVISLGLTSTFIRLENSYESLFFLIKNQFFFESVSINRLIFEQLNYCLNLSQFTPEEYENLSFNQMKSSLSPTNIKNLKNILPESEIGKFYSELSEFAHIDMKRVRDYLNFSEKVNDYLITLKDIRQSILSAMYLLKNTEIHGAVFEYCFYNLADIKLKFLKTQKEKLVLNPKRRTKTKYNNYVDRYNKLLILL